MTEESFDAHAGLVDSFVVDGIVVGFLVVRSSGWRIEVRPFEAVEVGLFEAVEVGFFEAVEIVRLTRFGWRGGQGAYSRIGSDGRLRTASVSKFVRPAREGGRMDLRDCIGPDR